MGNCFGSSNDGNDDVGFEERRRQAAEAAERRLQSEKGRGLKDPEGYQKKIEQRERLEQEQARAGGGGEGGLKWQVS